jgi:hypothetical protein
MEIVGKFKRSSAPKILCVSGTGAGDSPFCSRPEWSGPEDKARAIILGDGGVGRSAELRRSTRECVVLTKEQDDLYCRATWLIVTALNGEGPHGPDWRSDVWDAFGNLEAIYDEIGRHPLPGRSRPRARKKKPRAARRRQAA